MRIIHKNVVALKENGFLSNVEKDAKAIPGFSPTINNGGIIEPNKRTRALQDSRIILLLLFKPRASNILKSLVNIFLEIEK